MGRYIAWSDVTARYARLTTLANSSAALQDSFIQGAESEVDGRLARAFTPPFSDNNATVKDLAIDVTFLKTGVLNAEEYERMLTRIDKRFERLINGTEVMATTSGDLLAGDVAQAWSNTQDFHPAFGYLEPQEQGFDQDQLEDEASDREYDQRD